MSCRRPLPLTLTCALATCLVPSARASMVWVGDGSTALAHASAAVNPGEPDGLPFRTDPSSLSASYSSHGVASQLIPVGPDVINFSSDSFAQATGQANIGALHATSFVHAKSTPVQVHNPDTGGVFYSPLTTNPVAKMALGWEDKITVTSSSLPAGTPVQLRGTATLHSNVTTDSLFATAFARSTLQIGINSGGVGRAFQFEPFVTDLILTDRYELNVHTTPADRDVDFTLNVLVGDHIFVHAMLETFASAGSFGDVGDATANADAGNTSTFTLFPLTPGASYTTESGVTFIPEPASLAAFALTSLLPTRRPARRR